MDYHTNIANYNLETVWLYPIDLQWYFFSDYCSYCHIYWCQGLSGEADEVGCEGDNIKMYKYC